jgi:DNA-directed RNA polymerase omega subunit
MARISSQLAAKAVGNAYDLVLIAAARARELNTGHQPKIKSDNGPIITALTEIENKLIGREYLKKLKTSRKR